MTTQVMTTFGPGKALQTDAELIAYIKGLDCVGQDSRPIIDCYADVTLTGSVNPATYSATQRPLLRAAAGVGVNAQERTVFDIGTSGPALKLNRGTGTSAQGVDIEGFRWLVTGTGSGSALIINGKVQFNRIYDTSTATGAVFVVAGTGQSLINRNLIVVDGAAGKTVFFDGGSLVSYKGNLYAGRGAALGAVAAAASQYASGNTSKDEVFIGCGPELLSATITATNCFSNTTPTAGRTAGITVVPAAGGLVVNETNNFRPSATGALVGSGSASAENTDDILGNFTGTDPDAGPWEFDPAVRPAPPEATITSIAVEGRRVTVTATFTGSADSGLISLVPGAAPNGAATVSKAATISGSTTSAVFDLSAPGNYDRATVAMTGYAGTGGSTGGNAFTVNPPPVPAIHITSVVASRRTVRIRGTYTGSYPNEPLTAAISITSAGAPAASKGPVAIALNRDGTFSGRLMNLNYGSYSATSASITNYSGTGLDSAAGAVLASPAVAVGSVLTDITFQNTGGAQVNVPVTFGQVFREGDLPAAGAAVTLRASDNSTVPCQLDVKATNTDGSVRHAILSAIIPSLPANATLAYDIVRAASGPAGAVVAPADFSGLNATAVITETGVALSGPVTGVTYTADAAALLAAGTYMQWLSGPIVSEWILRVPFKTAGGAEHPDLHARFSIRAYKDQAKAKIDYIVENTWAKPKATPSGNSPWEAVSVTSHIYRATLKAGANVVMERAGKGYIYTPFTFAKDGTFDDKPTGLPNDATAYTATITVDGVAYPISITGSAAQNYGQLAALLLAQTSNSITIGSYQLAFQLMSKTTGPNSSVRITQGTLFPALTCTPTRPIYGDEVVHQVRRRWKKTYWWGAEPMVHIVPNRTYLDSTKAIPHYDPALVGSAAAIAADKAAMAANSDIGQNGIQKAYMGDVGYAPGIGILPEWTAMYLVNLGVDAKATMLKQADLAGSWPTFQRDYDTDMPISFTRWPYATYSANAGDSGNPATGLQEKLLDPAGGEPLYGSNNSPDVAHHPDFNLVPYLLTGDYCYLEGLVFYNRFTILVQNAHATYRDGGKGLLRRDQVRGLAWGLRTMAHALYAAPDGYALKGDIANILEQNRQWLMTNYVSSSGPLYNKLGVLWHAEAIVYAGGNGIGLFQDDFVTAVTGRMLELGFDEWLPVFQFKAAFPVGRLTSGTDFCWILSASTIHMILRDSGSSPIYESFKQMYKGTFGPEITSAACGSVAMKDAMLPLEGSRNVVGAMAGYPDTVGGYSANAQPAVAYTATYDATNGDDAWTVFSNRILQPDYNVGPQFAIVPRPDEEAAVSAPGDTTAPTVTAAAVASGTPGVVVLTSSEPLDTGTVPPASAFTVAGHTVDGVTLAGSAINLVVTPAFVSGEAARTVAYTKPASGGARDIAGNQLATFSAQAIANNVAAPVSTITGVAISPATVTIAGGGVQQFTATATGTNPQQAFTWTRLPAVGALTTNGSYTTPPATTSEQKIFVTATSQQDPNFTATAEVTVPAAAAQPGFTRSKTRTLKIKAAPLTFEGSAFWKLADPRKPMGSIDKDATIDISFDWTEVLADIGDSIKQVSFDLVGLTSKGGYEVGGIATVFVTAPTGNNPRITCHITTNSIPARVEERTAYLTIEDQ